MTDLQLTPETGSTSTMIKRRALPLPFNAMASPTS